MNLVGTDGSDLLIGDGGDDTLDGGAGSDQLDGRAGNDLLLGGEGWDELSGGVGSDTVLGGGGDDRFISSELGAAGDDSLEGGSGNDRFSDELGNNTLSGGEGDDLFIVWILSGGSNRASGGAGQDVWRVLVPSNTAADNDYVVDDFEAGPGGDLIDVRDLIFFTVANRTQSVSNPFDPEFGSLQLLQSGTDTVLQWDRDGRAGDAFGWFTVLTLRNTEVSRLIAENLVGGIPLDGSPVAGRTIDGTEAAETISGWLGDDLVRGFDGNDVFNPVYVPNDQSLVWATSLGDDTILGGAGNDTLIDWVGNNRLEGGPGSDLFSLYSTDGGSNTLSGGEGRDIFQPFGIEPGMRYRITDFEPGPGGDIIDLLFILQLIAANGDYAQGNPFDAAVGIFRLVEDGADLRLDVDRDGAAGELFDWMTILTLAGVERTALTSDNFTGPLRPDGSAGSPDRREGSPGPDVFDGDFDTDALYGLAGDDTLRGSGGDDSLFGGEGGDWIQGGLGSDLLDGGPGEDVFSVDSLEYLGDDTQLGGAGNDRLGDFAGRNLLVGGDGDDTLTVWDAGTPVADNTLSGGAGRDVYDIGFAGDSVYVVRDFAVGPGGDKFDLDRILEQSAWLGGGAGYVDGNPFSLGYLRFVRSGTSTLLQADLDAGGAAWSWTLILTLENVDPARITSDNFAGQFIVGTAGPDTLTGGLGNDTISGLGGDDELSGAEGRDTLDGGAGADRMIGGSGADTYYVDSRRDLTVEKAGSGTGVLLPAGGAGADPGHPLGTGSNIDTVIAQVNHTLQANVENLQLAGAAGLSGTGNALNNLMTGNGGANRLSGVGGNDLIDGAGGADTLLGGAGRDSLGGGAGADVLIGGDGNDVLTGGTGPDIFVFDSVPSAIANRDMITDFTSGSDLLRLDDDIFTVFLASQSMEITEGAFRSGPGTMSSGDSDDRILYDTSTGALYYDPDGSGPAEAVLFATLGSGKPPSLSAADFQIVD